MYAGHSTCPDHMLPGKPKKALAMCGCLPASLPQLPGAHCYSVTNDKETNGKGVHSRSAVC